MVLAVLVPASAQASDRYNLEAVPHDHQACDDITNLNLTAFDEMSDAAADVVWQLAHIEGPIGDGRQVKPGLGEGRKTYLGETAQR